MVVDFGLKVEHFDFEVLTQIDARIAADVAARGCPFCGGPLHVANYERKPRGGRLVSHGEPYTRRCSLCCGRRGCRKRVLPASMRFLGRRVYLEAAVVLASLVATSSRALRVAARQCGVCARTLKRWLQWWREEVICTSWWMELRSRLVAPVPDPRRLPASLLTHLRDIASGTKLATLVAQSLAPATTWLSNTTRFVGRALAVSGQN
jgi:hypothetical protein